MSITRERTTRPPGLDAATMAEAFQLTAAANADRCALRTKGDAFSVTWDQYADKVRALAPGLSAMGLGRGDSLAIMLTNRPEFHFFDAAALHLGATPFSIYNTYAPEQIQYQVQDAALMPRRLASLARTSTSELTCMSTRAPDALARLTYASASASWPPLSIAFQRMK